MSEESDEVVVKAIPQRPPFSPAGLLQGIQSIDENIANLQRAIDEQEARKSNYRELLKAHEEWEAQYGSG